MTSPAVTFCFCSACGVWRAQPSFFLPCRLSATLPQPPGIPATPAATHLNHFLPQVVHSLHLSRLECQLPALGHLPRRSLLNLDLHDLSLRKRDARTVSALRARQERLAGMPGAQQQASPR